jgi:hypothetical protein
VAASPIDGTNAATQAVNNKWAGPFPMEILLNDQGRAG